MPNAETSRDEDSGSRPLPGVGYLLDEERAARLARRVTSEGKNPGLGLTRAVVFLTNRCNMECRYCRSLDHPMPPWPDQGVESLLRDWAANRARHVHWTGGEASVVPRLREYVRLATDLGLGNSISTNGSMPPEVLRDLVNAGLKRFHVSLDSFDEERFDALTRSRGLLARIRNNLRLLNEMRQAGQDVSVVVNTILRPEGVRDVLADRGQDLKTMIECLIALGVWDFKFVVDTSRPWIAFFPDADAVADFKHICQSMVPAEFSMFHYRLRSLLAGGHGFHDDRVRHCFFCLDDRAADSRAVYPCIARLREGGSPLFFHADPIPVKQARLAAFVAEDRSRDPLCRQCCFDLYREMNDRVDWILRTEKGKT